MHDDQTVDAVGKMTEALETTERARGHLYSFHQLTGHADLLVDEAVQRLRAAGWHEQADTIERELVGRNVVEGRWTYQVVEEYDDGYYRCFTAIERSLREALLGGKRHAHEVRMKQLRRTAGHPAHTAEPQS